MGSGIAQTAAMAGFEVTVREVSEELLQKGFASIEKSLERFAGKGTITSEQQKETRDRLFGTTSFKDLADCDIIIVPKRDILMCDQNIELYLTNALYRIVPFSTSASVSWTNLTTLIP